jgi:hypothetical protein
MHNSNTRVLGAVWEYIVDNPDAMRRITPALGWEDEEEFYLHYYEKCLMEGSSGKPGVTKYGAAHEMARWFSQAPAGEHTLLVRAKDLLKRVYVAGDAETQTAVITGALEHILEEPRWRKFFEDWRKDRILRQAYCRAMVWADRHERRNGRSP